MRSCCTYHGHCAFCVWRAQSRRQTHSFWSAWHRFKQNATKDHMVVAMPSDRSHLHLVEGTRSWRKVCHHDSFISKSSFPQLRVAKSKMTLCTCHLDQRKMYFNQLACCGSIMFRKCLLFSSCGVQSLQFIFTESGALYWFGCFFDEPFSQ